MRKYQKLLNGFALTAGFGTVIGALAKLGDVAEPADPIRDLFYAFGLVSSGLLLWAFLCASLSLFARNGLHASLLTLCLLTPMLMSYYAVSRYYVGYYSPDTAYFWVLMLLPAAAGAWVLRAYRHVTWLRVLTGIAGAGAYLIDRRLTGGNIQAQFFEVMLLAGLFALLYSAGKVSQKESGRTPCRAVQFRYRQQTEL